MEPILEQIPELTERFVATGHFRVLTRSQRVPIEDSFFSKHAFR